MEVMSAKIHKKWCVPVMHRWPVPLESECLIMSAGNTFFSEVFPYILSLSSCLPASFDLRFVSRSP